MANKTLPRKYRYVHVLAVLVIMLSQACSTPGNQDPVPSAPVISATLTPANLPPEGNNPTCTPGVPSPTSAPISEPSPAQTPSEVGNFQFETLSDVIETGEIRSLWVDLGGHLWIGSEVGIYVYQEGDWEMVYRGPVERILGEDGNGVVWAILEGETQIASFENSQTRQVFGAEQGWTAPAEIEYLSPGYGDGLVTGPQGRVWLATGRDEVRVFEPESLTWDVLPASSLGFAPAIGDGYQAHFLTDVEQSRSQKVWVADCIGEGEILRGQGIRWTDGEVWFEAPDTATECVRDIEIDASGKMWVGGFDALLMYDPDLGYWTKFPLPPWERRQLVMEIDLDFNGSPWVEVLQYGGAGPLGGVVRYHLVAGEWIKDYEGWFSSLAFGNSGVAWLCSEGTIYRLESGNSDEVGEITGTECEIEVDGSGRVWITNYSELWWLDPGD